MTMTEAEWFASDQPWALFEVVAARLTPRKERLMALGLCRLLPALSLRPPILRVLAAAESLADRPATGRRAGLEAGLLGVRLAWGGHTAGSARSALDHAVAGNAGSTIAAVGLTRETLDGRPPAGTDHAMAASIRDIVGNPFRPVTFDPDWRSSTAVTLARQMYESREFSAMPILADALQDAGCEDDAILSHCRDPQQSHVRGCWVVDLVLGKS
jgi:hypothetical protein